MGCRVGQVRRAQYVDQTDAPGDGGHAEKSTAVGLKMRVEVGDIWTSCSDRLPNGCRSMECHVKDTKALIDKTPSRDNAGQQLSGSSAGRK